MSHTVLLVDDEPSLLAGLTRVLRKEPYEIMTAGAAEEAAMLLEEHNIDLIISDEEMPGMSGTEFLVRVAQEYPDTVRIVLTGYPTLSAALRAINEGKVYQFLTKPCNEIDLAITIRRALQQKDLLVKSRELLEVSKSQSALIEDARLLRRMRDIHPKDRQETAAKDEPPTEGRQLLDQIDQQVRKGRELLQDAATDSLPT